MAENAKDKIAEVSLERFLQNGIRSMTIKKLVEPLGISTKTVYKYFDSKEALLTECLHILYEAYYNEFSAIMSGDDNPVNKLLILFRATLDKDFGMSHQFFHDLNYYYPELQNEAISTVFNKHDMLMVPVVEKGIKEGYFLDRLDPRLTLKGIGTLYASITRGEEYRDYVGSPYPLFKNLVEIYIRGMCTEKGIKEIDNNPYHKK